ncbi:glucose-1-phosphate thymidylyltransferase [Paenibacillus sp. J31TS4]|uniref:sugar phosphate nucleotidyltransferase n=1 Tax=Paenibacillus sp. J31TS4 TaxID=2807195 RepID=UPI001B145B3F|nr:sugar phosphate nucleotidyltransferase [Paenibacillus sp. J31TS4]GIP39127.1 glucose-1-phosphate thymidylyltransferase [Paenibacillus sp. J31TS4]
MKGIILAGGTGRRLYPLTKLYNKHLLPIGGQPMILYGIQKLREAGIRDILLVTSRQAAGAFISYLGSGSEEGVSLTYRIQEEPGGVAQALSLAEGFVQPTEAFLVLLGDNLFEDSLTDCLEAYRQQGVGARVFIKKVDDPSRYGVPVLEEGRIVRIEEKPRNPRSVYCVTGIYLYTARVFDWIRTLAPSRRGELEVTDLNNLYAKAGQLQYDILKGWWIDAGTFDSLAHAAHLLKKRRK